MSGEKFSYLTDTNDFEDAQRGFIAPLPNNGIIKDKNGRIVWDLSAYDFLKTQEAPPATANPSLWRQTRLLQISGLFKITEGIYQIRGADAANMTIVEGEKGIIIIDVLTCNETAKVAIDLYYQHRPQKPVTAVIYTHSHADHFGGVKGVTTQEAVDRGEVVIYAPEGFTEATLDENILTGNVMSRRAGYQFGNFIKPSPTGQLSSGLCLSTASGELSLILPTHLIDHSHLGEIVTIDGIEIDFLFAPGSEAPSEMLFFFPQFRALCVAEDVNHTMHNLATLRGAKVRDARAWVRAIQKVIDSFGARTEVVFGQHHWPIWGNERAVEFLEKQRDMYKYIHDQTLRYANEGYSMIEIAEMIELPAVVANVCYNRPYYGSLVHNAKAVYNFYLGWFDGNPSTLWQLPPAESSKKMIEYMGGAENVLEKAQKDFSQGNYRWVAEILNQVVFADSTNTKAKALLAQTLEKLGFQSENAIWRNFFLTGAQELREGVARVPCMANCAAPDIIKAMPTTLLFEYFAVRLNGPRAAENPMAIEVNLPEKNERYILSIKNGVLNHFLFSAALKTDAAIELSRSQVNSILMGQTTLKELVETEEVGVKGKKEAVLAFVSLFDKFDPWFNIVES